MKEKNNRILPRENTKGRLSLYLCIRKLKNDKILDKLLKPQKICLMILMPKSLMTKNLTKKILVKKILMKQIKNLTEYREIYSRMRLNKGYKIYK